MTAKQDDKMIAFDICPGNQVLNTLAAKEGKAMDEEGEMAKQGNLLLDILSQLNDQEYYSGKAPKSLSNEAAQSLVFPILFSTENHHYDLLYTSVQHIANQIANAVKQYPPQKENASMLITGGGAFNNYLVEEIKKQLATLNVAIVVPYEEVVKFKEALIMALIGALRWREETNVLSSVTGASRDSISGALWMGHSYNGE